MRKATINLPAGAYNNGISIPAFREEGDTFYDFWCTLELISIPAFREEGDRGHYMVVDKDNNFNPRLP